MRYAYKILAKSPQGKRSLGQPTRKWKGNIKMHHKGMGCECVCTDYKYLRTGSEKMA